MAAPDRIDPDMLQRIFDIAMRLKPSSRASYLADACGANAALRAEVESLLAAIDGADGFLKSPTISRTLTPIGSDEVKASPARGDVVEPIPDGAPLDRDRSGEKIGRYVLRGVLGEGSFGTVYLAEQVVPYKRPVALKVLRPRPDVSLLVEQFRNEQRLMARMEHPNIAKVLDAGETDDGLPYLVVEQIKGLTLTRHCDHVGATIRERLQLMLQVCRGVQHAHGIGIIHRDLKPSNILVATYDGMSQPKVIDFGIARQVQTDSGDDIVDGSSTQRGGLAGTLLYLSPEQADVDAAMGDVQGDVYALGVVLFELLTGSTPLPIDSSATLPRAEVLRLIRQSEQPSVTSRLRELQDKPSPDPEIRRRAAEIVRRLGSLGAELDWVVGKAIAKDRADRYATVKDFATDIDSLMLDRPVQAGPNTLRYHARKYLRRHRAAAAAAGVLLAAMVAGSVGTSVGLVRARVANAALEERNLQLDQARSEAVSKTNEVIEKNRIADAALKRARGFSGILNQIVTSADPLNTKGRPATLADLVEELRAELVAHPELDHDVAGPVYSFMARALATDGKAIEARHWAKEGLEMVQASLPKGSSEEVDAQLAVACACMLSDDLAGATAALDAIGPDAEGQEGSIARSFYAIRCFIAMQQGRFADLDRDAALLQALESPPIGVKADTLSRGAINASAFTMIAALGQHDQTRARAIATASANDAARALGASSANAILWRFFDIALNSDDSNPTESRARLEKLLPDAQAAFGADNALVGAFDMTIGMLYVREGALEKAQPFLARANDISSRLVQNSGSLGLPSMLMSAGLGGDPQKMLAAMDAASRVMPGMTSTIDPAYAARLREASVEADGLTMKESWAQIIAADEPLLRDLPDWSKLTGMERLTATGTNNALMLAMAKTGRGREADAISLKWLERCTNYDTHQGDIFVLAAFTRWEVLNLTGQPTPALEMVEKVLEPSPAARETLTGPFMFAMMKGVSLAELHRYDEAEPLLGEALRLGQNTVGGSFLQTQLPSVERALLELYHARGDDAAIDRLVNEHHLKRPWVKK